MFGAVLVLTLTQPAPAQDADAGRAIYQAKCLACHGATGQGDGPAARALPKKPRNMTEAAFWEEFTDARIRSVVKQGKPGSNMRAFPMSDAQVANLIAYLHTFQPP